MWMKPWPSFWRRKVSARLKNWLSVDPHEIASIDGLDEATAEELQIRANAYLEKQAAEFEDKRKALGVQDDLAGFDGLTPP